MDQSRRIVNLALVGFMGTGKSTVGHLVASMLHFKFVDTDEMIEKRAGKRISEIFATDGEGQFRLYEKETVAQLSTLDSVVISTGGGLIMNPENLASLKKHALVICLWANAKTIYARVGHQTHRPLLQTGDPLETITNLLNSRKPAYLQADVLINSELRSPREVAQHVVQNYRSVCRHQPSL
jgi:shikimate kinase